MYDVCVCMYACMHACMHVCMHACMNTYTHRFVWKKASVAAVAGLLLQPLQLLLQPLQLSQFPITCTHSYIHKYTYLCIHKNMNTYLATLCVLHFPPWIYTEYDYVYTSTYRLVYMNTYLATVECCVLHIGHACILSMSMYIVYIFVDLYT